MNAPGHKGLAGAPLLRRFARVAQKRILAIPIWRGMLPFLGKEGRMVNISLLILRLCLGIVFLAHGLQVVAGLFGGPGMQGFSAMLGNMGFKPALLWAYVAGYTEFLGGLCLILGILPRLAAFSILIFMLVAVYAAHLSKGFFIQNGGFEYNFVLICICVVIMLLGAGRFSILNKF